MKPYPSVFHAHTSEMGLVISVFESNRLDEVSNRIPPTSQGMDVGQAPVRPKVRNGEVHNLEASIRSWSHAHSEP